ncbi:glycosyltransferase family 2 protein [Methylobacter sp. sgz302048]|uniref:glycosyltransferase family 2 protein n=1 Tax=Methylobacter sp. sgz302048 TaxID=3455945 RepID=UPI003FA18490
MGEVTVIIVNWNGGTLLDECLASLAQQSYPPTQVLLMDNGSTDGSAQRARQMPGITVRFLGDNFGFAAANNRALSECDTEFVALLNPDASPGKDWLMNLVNAAQACPGVAAFGSRQMNQRFPKVIDGLGDVYHVSGLVWRNGYGRTERAADAVPDMIFSPCACAALYRREALVNTGGFDEDFFCYVEDVDLGFRLRLAGYSAMYVPDAVVYHAGSASTGGQHSDFSVYHGHRNLVWTYIKNMPGSLFWILLPVHVFLNLVSIIYFSIHGKGKVIVRAKRDSLKGIPKMWRKRREIQSNRRASVMAIWRSLDKRLWLAKKY